MVRLEIVMMEIELRYGGSQLKKYLHVMVEIELMLAPYCSSQYVIKRK
jgi:hypothetical protein